MDELGDDLLLLATHSGQRLDILAELRLGLSGSELVRLVAARRVDIVRGRIVVLGTAPTGDALLDDALRSITGRRRRLIAKAWVARLRPGLVERYLARLECAGTIRVERRKVLGFIPSIRWTIVDRARAALAGLASATGVAAFLYPGKAGAAARKRLEQTARRDPAAGTVTRAVIGAVDATYAFVIGIVGAMAGGSLQELTDHHTLSIRSFHVTSLIGWVIGALVAYRLMLRLTGLKPGRRR